MREKEQFGVGVALVFMTVVLWGTQFPIGKSAMVSIDAIHVTAVRYALAGVVLVAWLALAEGREAFDYRGRFGLMALAGFLGFAVSGFCVFVGLSMTRPEAAAIVTALQPSMAALADWALRGRRPSLFTLACVAAAFGGVLLVVTRGDPAAALSGGDLTGTLFVLAGGMMWVTYTMMSERLSSGSALRYTTLTLVPGAVAILLMTLIAELAGWAIRPPLAAIGEHWLALAYLGIGGIVIAMTWWNIGLRRIGALNAMLFMSFLPVVTFLIRVGQGARFTGVEIAGVVLVVGALIANNLFLRHQRAGQP